MTYKEKVIEEFNQFISSDDDFRFVLSKMTSKLGEVAIDDMKRAFCFFLLEALDKQMKLTLEALPDDNYTMLIKAHDDKFKSNLKERGLI